MSTGHSGKVKASPSVIDPAIADVTDAKLLLTKLTINFLFTPYISMS
jgi:hypothetical protein